MSNPDLTSIIDLVNDLWNKTYGGTPVSNIDAIKARIIGIFDDRKCWYDNAVANQKEYLKLEKKLKKLKNEKSSITS